MREKDDFDDMGLVLDRKTHALTWGLEHGHLRWTPYWFRRVTVAVWNHIACAIWGHCTFGPIEEQDEVLPDGRRIRYKYKPKVCVNCCKEWPRDP